jgi:hypothetical protein
MCSSAERVFANWIVPGCRESQRRLHLSCPAPLGRGHSQTSTAAATHCSHCLGLAAVLCQPSTWTSQLHQRAMKTRGVLLLLKVVLHCLSELIRCGAPTRRGVAVVQRGRRSVRTAGCRLCSCAAFPRPRALHHWPPLPCTPLRAFKLLPKGFGPQSKVDFGKDDSKSPPCVSVPLPKKSSREIRISFAEIKKEPQIHTNALSRVGLVGTSILH